MPVASVEEHETRYRTYLEEFNRSLPAGTADAERERLLQEALIKLVERDLQAIEEQAVQALDGLIAEGAVEQNEINLDATRQALAS